MRDLVQLIAEKALAADVQRLRALGLSRPPFATGDTDSTALQEEQGNH